MTIESHDLIGRSREEWLALRRNDVTASRTPALFNLDPYCSRLRLHHEKSGLLDLAPDADSPILRRGRLFESAVAEAVREERPQWLVEKAHVYLRDAEIRLGATPDFFIHGDPRGLGILQAKTCSATVYEREWRGVDKMPFNTVLQTLTEMMLADAAFGAAAALKIDPFDTACAIVEIERHPASEQRIRDAVVKFWDDVAHGREPGPDFALDRDLIAALMPQEFAGKTLNCEGDNELIAGLVERAELKDQSKRAADRCAEIEAMIMQRMGDAESLTGISDFRVTWRTTKTKEYVVRAREQRVLRIIDKRDDAA